MNFERDNALGELGGELGALQYEVLRSVWEVSPLGFVLLKPGTEKTPIVIADCNPAVCENHGYTREELIGESIDALQAVPWTHTIGKKWFESLRHKEQSGQAVHRRKDGSTFLISYRTAYFEVDGVPYALGIDKVVREEEELDNEARQVAERWIKATEGGEDGVWDWDPAKDTVWVSARWNGILGRVASPETTSRRAMLRAVHPEDRSKIVAGLRAVMEGRSERFLVEYRARHASGAWIWILSKGKLVTDREGRPQRMLGTVAEITDRKRMEEELYRARLDAEAANIAKSRFLATMSHEIRTPLNGVLGVAVLLEDTQLDDDQRMYLKTIRESGEALMTVINDVLDYSKVESGTIELERQWFETLDCVEGAFDVLAPLAREKGLGYALEVDPGTPRKVFGDSNRIRQVLLNLLGNAIKFTPKGEARLRVSARAGAAEGEEELALEVIDTGIGITAEARAKLFQPFSQVDASTSRRYGGTGLGLVISQRLARLMGGEIELESPTGEGTCFRLSLAMRSSKTRVFAGADCCRGKTVVVASDSLEARRCLEPAFEAIGASGKWVSSFADCMQLLETEPADLVVADAELRSPVGERLVDRLREGVGGRAAPLALLRPIDAGPMEDPGKYAFSLRRPIKSRELVSRMNRFFRSSCRGRSWDEKGGGLPGAPARPRSERVLLVDDNEVNSMIVATFLEKLGYAPDVAENGYEAVEMAARQDYDLIFLDLHMPGISGQETFERMRAVYQEKAHRPWVVALTADAMEGDREACLAMGMNDYLSKPLRPADLERALSRAQLGS